MTQIEAIRERHSVRSYLSKRIEPEKIEMLNSIITLCNQISGLHFQFIEDAGKTFNRLLNRAMGLGSAPSVIACVGKESESLEENIGFYGEKIVLYAQQLGLNTCWAGTFNPKNVNAQIDEGERLVLVIAIGYGADNGKAHKSKTIEQVSSCEGIKPAWFDFAVEMALLAPTAMNQQRFMITLKSNGLPAYEDKKGPFSKVDLGIVRYHFEQGMRSYIEESMRK